MIKATERDRSRLLNYLLEEETLNIFLISDIENFGFHSDIQDVWYSLDVNKQINGVVLKYHTILIIYSHDLSFDFKKINIIIKNYEIETISGKKEVIDQLKTVLSSGYCYHEVLQNMALCTADISQVSQADIEVADISDSKKIAESYQEIEEFKGLYSQDIDQLSKQISTRIETEEGKHVFIQDNKGIIAHGNTTAENEHLAMLGGIFVRPDQRNKGYARKIIEHLIFDIQSRDKKVVLIYEDKLADFYQQFGFVKQGQWSSLGRV